MNRTVKDISKALGTNKNVIYRIIEKLNITPVDNGEGASVKMYDDNAYSDIKKAYRKLQEKHGDHNATPVTDNNADNSDLILFLQNQLAKNEAEIERLNDVIKDKDALIKDLTDKLTETVKANHIETVRYQEILAREQTTKLLTAQSQTRFNLFKPSTWKKRQVAETPDLEPLTDTEKS